MANQFLIKNRMADMRALSASEITALQNGTYDGVELLGYYQKGDTATPIIYYLAPASPDPGSDNGGSVIEVGSVKLEHRFNGTTDIIYFGAAVALSNNYEAIQNCFANNNIRTCKKIKTTYLVVFILIFLYLLCPGG